MGKFVKVGYSSEKYVIGGYKVMDLIGKGAFGSVYLAHRGDN